MSDNNEENPYQAYESFDNVPFLEKHLGEATDALLLKIQQQIDDVVHVHQWQVTVSPNHTAARWCSSCGKTYASTFAGNPSELQWHRVAEAQEGE